MAAIKLTMLLQISTNVANPAAAVRRTGGWTESVYYDGALTPGLMRSFNTLCRTRTNLLGIGGSCVGQRFQQVDPVGSAQTAKNAFRSTLGLATDTPGQSLQLNSRGAGVANVRRAHLTGIPDACVVNGEFAGNEDWNANYFVFLTNLAGWKFRARDLTLPKVIVKTVDTDGVVTFASDLALAVGDKVSLYRLKNAFGKFVNGTFTVGAATTLRSVTLLSWTAGACTDGKAQKFSPIYPAITAAGTVQGLISQKKVGRPFDQFRGRRSKRK